MLWGRLLTSPHPRAKVKRLDVSKAEKMPGVAYILTPGNAPKSYPLPDELFFQGEIVAIVAADSEDLAHDAADAIEVEYDLLPFAATLQQIMSPDAPELRRGTGNVIRTSSQYGDVEKAFAQADVVKEFTYQYSSGIPVPLQPVGGVAKWFECRSGAARWRRKIRAVHSRDPELEGDRISIQNQFDSDRSFPKQYAAGIQVRLGADDG